MNIFHNLFGVRLKKIKFYNKLNYADENEKSFKKALSRTCPTIHEWESFSDVYLNKIVVHKVYKKFNHLLFSSCLLQLITYTRNNKMNMLGHSYGQPI